MRAAIIDGALRLYREAMAGTAEAIRRNPDDPQRLFDHAQNVFYVGEIARDARRRSGAERAMREYKRLAPNGRARSGQHEVAHGRAKCRRQSRRRAVRPASVCRSSNAVGASAATHGAFPTADPTTGLPEIGGRIACLAGRFASGGGTASTRRSRPASATSRSSRASRAQSRFRFRREADRRAPNARKNLRLRGKTSPRPSRSPGGRKSRRRVVGGRTQQQHLDRTGGAIAPRSRRNLLQHRQDCRALHKARPAVISSTRSFPRIRMSPIGASCVAIA